MAEILYNENGINYGVAAVTGMQDLYDAQSATQASTPIVIKVDGTPVASIGPTGLVLRNDGTEESPSWVQDHFEINCTS